MTEIDKALKSAREAQHFEFMIRDRSLFHFEGGRLKWGESISPENMERLRNAEVFILENESGVDHAMILMDVFGNLRQKLFNSENG